MEVIYDPHFNSKQNLQFCLVWIWNRVKHGTFHLLLWGLGFSWTQHSVPLSHMNPGCIKAKITIFKQPCTPSHLSLRCQVSQAAHLRHKQRLLLLLLLTSGVSLPHFTYSFLLDFSHKSLLSAPLWLLILCYNPFLSLVLTMEQSKLEAGLEDWFLLQHRAFLIHPFTFVTVSWGSCSCASMGQLLLSPYLTARSFLIAHFVPLSLIFSAPSLVSCCTWPSAFQVSPSHCYCLHRHMYTPYTT